MATATKEMCIKRTFQQGTTIKLLIKRPNVTSEISVIKSKKFTVNQAVVIQVRITVIDCNRTDYYDDSQRRDFVCLKFAKHNNDINDNKIYQAALTCNELDIERKIFLVDNSWRDVTENGQIEDVMSFTIEVAEVHKGTDFASLHDDTDLTDFNLKSEHGSVALHRAVLAAYSPVFKTMLGGTWKDTTEGCIDIPGLSTKTLEDFKAYLYLHHLPDSDLEELLLLASCYMISDLEQKCIQKLVTTLTVENVMSRFEFSVLNKMVKLTLAIMKCIQCGAIRVDDISNFVFKTPRRSVAVEGNEKSEDE